MVPGRAAAHGSDGAAGPRQAGGKPRASGRAQYEAMRNRWLLRGAAGTAAAAAILLTSAPAMAHGAPQRPATTSQTGVAAPATVANTLLNAWQRRNRAAALRVATPAVVRDLFASPLRSPDVFRGCTGNVCRFAYTSVRTPGGLNAIVMVVSGNKVTKIYMPRFITKPANAAKHLFAAWRAGDRNRGLEVATPAAVNALRWVRGPKGTVPYSFMGCSKAPKQEFRCSYWYEGGAMHMWVNGSAARGYQVYKITFFAD